MTGEKKLMTYVVQRERTLAVRNPAHAEDVDAWEDIATVVVESRTKRSTVIKRALAESGLAPAEGEKVRLRALDVESAEVHEPEAYQPPMEWKLP